MNFEHTRPAPFGAGTTALAPDDGEDRRRRPHYRTYRFPAEINQELKTLAKPDTLRAAAAAVEDWTLIGLGSAAVLAGAAHLDQPWGAAAMVAGWVVNGSRMRALATLLHESAHKTLSPIAAVNNALGTVASAWWVLQLRHRYEQSHVDEHHRHLGDPENDPDTRQYVRQGLLDEDAEHFIARNVGVALTASKTLVNLPYLLRDRLLPKPGTRMSVAAWTEVFGFLAAWSFLIAFLATKGWLLAFLLVWVVPYLTTFQAINWLIETSEHFPLAWTRSDPFQWTRNRKGSLLERFFFGCHGESWHRVHHERPLIPFWNLKRAHEAMMRDPAYAEFEAETGGLFTRGPNDAPSILSTIRNELRALSRARQA